MAAESACQTKHRLYGHQWPLMVTMSSLSLKRSKGQSLALTSSSTRSRGLT
jgi:hypothetical protein